MARLFIAALEAGGHRVDLVSELRSLEAVGSAAAQSDIEAEAERERARLANRAEGRAETEVGYDAWFTYHHYYKAPDLLGPHLSKDWGIPYLVAEASHAPKRLVGPWANWARMAEESIRQADKVLTMTAFDRECLEPLAGPQKLVTFPPFLNAQNFLETPLSIPQTGKPARLLSVAMMRSGDKLESYRRLALALERLKYRPWHLTIAGDGPERAEVEALFQALPEDQVKFIGAVEPKDLPALYAEADLFLWPGAGEAYGMVYLEAAASGLAVVAQAIRGVPDVVMDGRTGILTPDDDQTAYATAIGELLTDPERCAELGKAGREFIRQERDLPHAATRLNALFTGMGLAP